MSTGCSSDDYCSWFYIPVHTAVFKNRTYFLNIYKLSSFIMLVYLSKIKLLNKQQILPETLLLFTKRQYEHYCKRNLRNK